MQKTTLISKGFLSASCVASILGCSLTANAAGLTPVSLELMLLIDASDSISSQHFDAQINALNNIFNDANFYNDFLLPLKDNPALNIDDPSLAVSIFQFGAATTGDTAGDPILNPILDWTVFNEQHQSGIGQLDPNTITKIGGFTPLGDTLGIVIDELANNDYEGHQTVNLSSDGFDTFSSMSVPLATREAFRSGVTFNVLAIPAIGGQIEQNSFNSEEDDYDLDILQAIVDRYPNLPPQYKNNNLAGNAPFLMLDYATGEKTIEDAFRLKLGLETIGYAPPSRPSVDEPDTEPTDTLDPTNTGGTGTSTGTIGQPTADTGDIGTGTGIIGEPTADPANIPEPNFLWGLLSISLLGLLGHNKRA
ncbi:DUF1194 domain-containing protein [Cyanothece sp. BG0011]|uniref:DUF1194 domain-containing protein n=1 Tax=Cyanothece sp. BG0011 TaxID=2082950 RepID=UPI000D1F12E3|nr:DUF1194 domain-containing protein [Cyanothece sp. BG0011]